MGSFERVNVVKTCTQKEGLKIITKKNKNITSIFWVLSNLPLVGGEIRILVIEDKGAIPNMQLSQ